MICPVSLEIVRVGDPEGCSFIERTGKRHSSLEVSLGKQPHAVSPEAPSRALSRERALEHLEPNVALHCSGIMHPEFDPVVSMTASQGDGFPIPRGLQGVFQEITDDAPQKHPVAGLSASLTVFPVNSVSSMNAFGIILSRSGDILTFFDS